MEPMVRVVLSIDGDPDPVLNPDTDPVVLRKYHKMWALVDEYCDGKATMTIHSSPVFRDRFFSADYLAFWRAWAKSGKDLALHIEDDLYRLSPAPPATPSVFQHPATIFNVIAMMQQRLNAANIACRCFRGGSNGQSLALARYLTARGIDIDLSCAPGLYWPERGVNWLDAPASAWFAAADNLAAKSAAGPKTGLMIPLGWDGISPEDRRRPTVNYLANETSETKSLQRVWDSIVRRASDGGQTQVVSLLCHTYSAEDEKLHKQLKGILTYITRHNGQFVSIDMARQETQKHASGGAQSK